MKLTYNEILSAVNGSVRCVETQEGLQLHRFSEKQEKYLLQPHPLYSNDSFFDGYFYNMSRTYAGITMDFISNAREIKITFSKTEYGKSKIERKHYFDLFVDRAYVQSYLSANELVYKSTGENKRFTLYFPYYAFPTISSVELEGATMFSPIQKKTDILFLGDSITHGANAQNPSNTYVMRIAGKLDIGILNQGISGFVYDAGTVDKVCEPQIVVTAYGVNDYFRKNPAQIENDTAEFLERVKEFYENSKIVSVLPLWISLNGKNKDFKKAERQSLAEIYSKYSDITIDGFELIPHDERYYSDEVHPNDEGFAVMGERISGELEKIIKQEI